MFLVLKKQNLRTINKWVLCFSFISKILAPCWQLLLSSSVTFSATFNPKSIILGHFLGTGIIAKRSELLCAFPQKASCLCVPYFNILYNIFVTLPAITIIMLHQNILIVLFLRPIEKGSKHLTPIFEPSSHCALKILFQ